MDDQKLLAALGRIALALEDNTKELRTCTKCMTDKLEDLRKGAPEAQAAAFSHAKSMLDSAMSSMAGIVPGVSSAPHIEPQPAHKQGGTVIHMPDGSIVHYPPGVTPPEA